MGVRVWEIRVTSRFEHWYLRLSDEEAEDVTAVVDLLEEHGAALGFPFSSGVASSRHAHMRELRIQHAGRPYRILYAFDPWRSAVLLLGGDKSGDDRWYEKHVLEADRLYEAYLAESTREH